MRKVLKERFLLAEIKVKRVVYQVQEKLCENSGNFLEELIKYIIGIVIGALILVALYALIKTTLMPTIGERIKKLFDYSA